jgi:hypothetical protein
MLKGATTKQKQAVNLTGGSPLKPSYFNILCPYFTRDSGL